MELRTAIISPRVINICFYGLQRKCLLRRKNGISK